MRDLLTRRDIIVGATAITVAPIPQALRANTPAIHEVAIQSFQFGPAILRVRVGDAIRWTNHDLAPHTATADQFGWDTGTLERGEMAAIKVTAGMELSYFCIFHPHMKGRVVLVA
jgi:plastocyanin